MKQEKRKKEVKKHNDITNEAEKTKSDKNLTKQNENQTSEKESIEVTSQTPNNPSKKKKRTINGISLWRILAYFIIYSVAGYVIETLYGIATKGVWESRQSFLYGPFCGIYGLGAVIMIVCLHKIPRKFNTLFIGGFIVGSIVEYAVSFIGEMLLGVKWWDYSGMPLNINGRICVYFSIFWGFLGIYLIASLNPKVDKIIDWIKSKFKSYKTLKTFVMTVFILLMIDCVATGFAIEFFLVRVIVQHDINVANKEQVIEQYDKIYGNENLSKFIYEFWGDKKMIRTFPNLKVTDKDGNIVYIDSLLGIQPYYVKVHDKNNKNNEEVEADIRGEEN